MTVRVRAGWRKGPSGPLFLSQMLVKKSTNGTRLSDYTGVTLNVEVRGNRPSLENPRRLVGRWNGIEKQTVEESIFGKGGEA
jgi:hypothetical protein